MSNRFMVASTITKRPVVTLAGDDIAQIKDVVFGEHGGGVSGFTLAGRGLLSGPMSKSLPWPGVAALGPDAVMVANADALTDTKTMMDEAASSESTSPPGNVLGSRVLTVDGTDLGKVVDVVIEVTGARSVKATVVGYEIEPTAAVPHDAKRVFIPLPVSLAASGENVVVPTGVEDYVAQDIDAFGSSLDDYRARRRPRAVQP